MKVLLINNRHFPGGGTETVYFNTAQLLKQAGHEVVFFSIKRENNLACPQDSYFVDEGSKLKRLKNFFYNKDASKKLERLIIDEKPDIAHIHLFWGGLSPSILKTLRKHNVPVVHTVHEYRMVCPAYLLKDGKGKQCDRCKNGKFYQCFFHRCSKDSWMESLIMTLEIYHRNRKYHPSQLIDGFIFVSNFTRNKHIEFDSRFAKVQSTVLYNCPNDIITQSLDLKWDSYESYYLYYGRLSIEKGVSTLISAFERYPQLKLLIVGSGPLEMELREMCKEKQLMNIEFLGFKTGSELFDLVSHAKYVCVPSECYENNPMTVVEGYSLAVPVIGAGIGGTAEIVRDCETGYVFQSGSVDSLSNVINKTVVISRDEYLRQKENAYDFGKKNFSREVHLKKLLQFYNTIINLDHHQ